VILEVLHFRHWLKMMKRLGKNAPLFFHVNWFRKGKDGKFLWPGFSENFRVLLWIIARIEGKTTGEGASVEQPFGDVPTPEALNLEGLDLAPAQLKELLEHDSAYAVQEMSDRDAYIAKFGRRYPKELKREHEETKARVLAEAAVRARNNRDEDDVELAIA